MSKNIFKDTGEQIQIDSNHMIGVKMETKYIQVYADVQELMLRINRPTSFHLFFWIIINMDKYNIIHLTSNYKQQFIDEIVAQGHKTYSQRNIGHAIKELKDAEILEYMTRSEYRVNALFFWKDTIIKRQQFIESKYITPVAKNNPLQLKIKGKLTKRKYEKD